MIQKPLDLLKLIPPKYLKVTSNLTLNLLDFISISKIIRKKEKRILNNVKKLHRVLVVADYNIGDSLLILPAVGTLKYYLKDVEIDYIFNEGVESLIGKIPFISNIFPIFSSSVDFSYKNLNRLMSVIKNKGHDVIFNFCPFFNENHFKNIEIPILYPWRLIFEILESYHSGDRTHISYRIVEYIKDIIYLLRNSIKINDLKDYKPEMKLYIDEDTICKSREFLRANGLDLSRNIIFIHPDSSSKYTFINGDFYKKLIYRLSCNDKVGGIILGPTYNFRNINRRICHYLKTKYRNKVIYFPEDASIEFFAALVDCCSVYIGLDTGPIHIVAAKKFGYNKKTPLNNRTAIVGLYKASDSRIYGYDSFSNLHIDSYQNAPARVFEAKPRCKSISCTLQKIIRTCKYNYCDRLLDADKVYIYIKNILDKYDKNVLYQGNSELFRQILHKHIVLDEGCISNIEK